LVREKVQNKCDARLEGVQLLYTAYNRLGSLVAIIQGNKL